MIFIIFVVIALILGKAGWALFWAISGLIIEVFGDDDAGCCLIIAVGIFLLLGMATC